jgi:hypothetical protein
MIVFKPWLNEDESWWEPQLSFAFDHQLSHTLVIIELVQILMGIDESFGYVK